MTVEKGEGGGILKHLKSEAQHGTPKRMILVYRVYQNSNNKLL